MTKRWRWAIAGALLCTAVGACGSEVNGGGGSGPGGSGAASSSGSGPGPSGAAWDDYCEARAAACSGSPDKCKTQEGCAKALIRDAIEVNLFGCLAQSCDEDQCIGQASASVPLSGKGQEFLTACEAYLDMCPEGLDDLCVAAGLFADDALAPLQSCLSGASCKTIEDCLDSALAVSIDACEDWL